MHTWFGNVMWVSLWKLTCEWEPFCTYYKCRFFLKMLVEVFGKWFGVIKSFATYMTDWLFHVWFGGGASKLSWPHTILCKKCKTCICVFPKMSLRRKWYPWFQCQISVPVHVRRRLSKSSCHETFSKLYSPLQWEQFVWHSTSSGIWFYFWKPHDWGYTTVISWTDIWTGYEFGQHIVLKYPLKFDVYTELMKIFGTSLLVTSHSLTGSKVFWHFKMLTWNCSNWFDLRL